MKNDSLLIINDVTGYGRVSTFAMLPVLSKYNIHAYVLPTALVSNTMDYGSAEIMDTTLFMKNTINKWSEFGFTFSNIVTGLINSKEQAEIIIDLISRQDNPYVIVDPIMADDGKLYPDMYAGAVECNRKLILISNVIVPNITEATMLIDEFIGRTVFSDEEYCLIIDKLKGLGSKDIIITGCESPDGTRFNLVYDSKTGQMNKCIYTNVPHTFIGTGDVFTATLTAELIKGTALLGSVKMASRLVKKIVENNINNKDPYDLIIEPFI